VLSDRQRMRNVPDSGWRTRWMPEQPPPQLLRHLVLWLVALTAARLPVTVMSSCQHLGEHLLGSELVPMGAARVLADGGDKVADLVVASDPELNPAGAAADVPG